MFLPLVLKLAPIISAFGHISVTLLKKVQKNIEILHKAVGTVSTTPPIVPKSQSHSKRMAERKGNLTFQSVTINIYKIRSLNGFF